MHIQPHRIFRTHTDARGYNMVNYSISILYRIGYIWFDWTFERYTVYCTPSRFQSVSLASGYRVLVIDVAIIVIDLRNDNEKTTMMTRPLPRDERHPTRQNKRAMQNETDDLENSKFFQCISFFLPIKIITTSFTRFAATCCITPSTNNRTSI